MPSSEDSEVAAQIDLEEKIDVENQGRQIDWDPTSTVEQTVEKDSALEHIVQSEVSAPTTSRDFPEGGLRAWLIAAGAFVALFTTFGYLNAFGVYQAYYSTTILKHNSASAISWIGSIQVFFLQSAGLLSGSAFDRFGVRACIVPASIGIVVSLMLTSKCTEYYQFVLAQGVLGGISQGFIFTPCMGCLSQYFQKRRSFAMGIVIGGSSLGGIIFPIMLENFLANPRLGFGWTVRIIGFLFIGLLALACASMKERLPHRKGQFFLPAAFKQPSYSILLMANFFILVGLFIPLFYLPTYALSKGMSTRMSIYLIAVLNGFSFPGRVIPGYLADRLGRMNVLIFFQLCISIILWFWIKAETNAGLIVWAAFFGFCSGGCVSLQPACVAQITPNTRDIGTYLGMASSLYGVAGLTGSPIAGQLLNHGWSAVVYFSAGTAIIGLVFLTAARLSYERKIMAIV